MAKVAYTKIENYIFDAMFQLPLSLLEFKVLCFLVRYSKGFHRETAKASYAYIAKGINCSDEGVRKAIKKLEKLGLVSIEYEHSGSSASIRKILYKNFTTRCGTQLDKMCPEMVGSCGTQLDQEIKEEIKDKKEKKERENPHFSGNIVEMSDEEWAKMNEEDFDDE